MRLPRLHNFLFGAACWLSLFLAGSPSLSGWLQLAGLALVGATLMHASNVHWREREEELAARCRGRQTEWHWTENQND
jgi:hypothetical protein